MSERAERDGAEQGRAGQGPAPDAWRQAMRVAAVFQLALTLMVGAQLWARGATSLAAGYFFDHDAWLLVAGGAMLLVLARWSLKGAPVPPLTRARLWLWAGAAAIAAYAGTFVVFHHYPATRDEQSALFAATYFAEGRMGWPIPAGLGDLAQAMMPMHTTVRPGAWLSNYLPVNAAIRAGAAWLGDAWLAGPLLLLVGALALASAARRIWPDRPQGAAVAVVLALTSTQVLVNAATPFAMTAQFAATALWLACFVRGEGGGASGLTRSFLPPRRRPGSSWEGPGDEATASTTSVPQLGPGLRRGGEEGRGAEERGGDEGGRGGERARDGEDGHGRGGLHGVAGHPGGNAVEGDARPDPRFHALAMLVGLFASGLHQSHFHIGFVLAFAAWLASERRFRLAACYVLAGIVYWAAWQRGWLALVGMVMGPQLVVSGTPPPVGVNPILWRISQLQIGESLTRFIAWQNVLLLPLVIAGAGALRHATGPARVLIGCAFACTLGLMLLVLQDHGYGYRYLHHLIPCFCLLGAGGWLALEERIGQRLPASALAASALFAACVTLPVTVWRSMAANAPYERAYAAARAADADYLLVDTRAGAYLQDIVRVEEGRTRPVLLDLGYVPAPALVRICAGGRVMVFGEAQARHFAVPVSPDAVANEAEATARAAQLKRLRCGVPMPF